MILFSQPEEAATVRFERDFYRIVLFLGFVVGFLVRVLMTYRRSGLHTVRRGL